ncbi:MAG: efflux RND transporter periplasmic adaptor subunit [Kofleriaceae bacterium]
MSGSNRRWPRIVGVIVGLLVILGALAGVKFWQISSLIAMGEQAEKAGPPPESVSTDKVISTVWDRTISAVGTVTGVNSVTVANEAAGVVTKINFESGDMVKRGEVLAELDVGAEQAQLASAIARRDLRRLNVRRSRKLVASGALARATLDEEETQLASAEREVEALRAGVNNKRVRAPFAGKTGIRAISVGQFLAPGTTVTTVESTGGVYVDFSVPQGQREQIGTGNTVRISVRGEQVAEGTITAIDPQLDPATRNLRVRATVPEPGDRLRSGMFVSVSVVLPERKPALIIPQTAVVHAPYGDSVFIVEKKPPGSPGMTTTPDGRPVAIARQQFVKLGDTRGDFVAITEGIKEGQQVVSAGAFKLRNNSPVVVDNSVKPKPQLDPKPENR